MRYIFYADVYFIQNFMMKVAVLYLALYCNKMLEKISMAKGIGKICIASFMGTLIEIIGLLFGSSYGVFITFVHFFQVPFMTCFVLGKAWKQMLRVVLSGYFFTMLVNAVLEVLWNQFGEHGSYIFCLLFSCGAVIVGIRIWKNYTKMQRGLFQVQLVHLGKQIRAKAFYDTGNRLKEPYTGKGVHIVSENILEEATVGQPVYIPYQSLGNEAGMLEVYYLDKIIIEGENKKITIQNCPVGVTKDNLFEGKNYEMILNEEVF